jgi:hypothetical protein
MDDAVPPSRAALRAIDNRLLARQQVAGREAMLLVDPAKRHNRPMVEIGAGHALELTDSRALLELVGDLRQRMPPRERVVLRSQTIGARGRRDRRHIQRRAMLATLVFAGLRIGELLGLLWHDVELGAGRITVRESKTSAGVRQVDVLPVLRDILVMLEPRGPNELVFPTSIGKAHGATNIRRRVLAPAVKLANKRLEEAADVPLPSPFDAPQLAAHVRVIAGRARGGSGRGDGSAGAHGSGVHAAGVPARDAPRRGCPPGVARARGRRFYRAAIGQQWGFRDPVDA